MTAIAFTNATLFDGRSDEAVPGMNVLVVDGRIGYTGSLNLVDPRYFKKDAGFGEWVDAMVRVEGPAVEAMQIIFLADWYVESHT